MNKTPPKSHQYTMQFLCGTQAWTGQIKNRPVDHNPYVEKRVTMIWLASTFETKNFQYNKSGTHLSSASVAIGSAAGAGSTDL